MKEFRKTKQVTYNLMSFTGFKSVLIFSCLLEGAKTYEDIQKCIYENEFLHETISVDAIRVYLNSLRSLGCNIIRTTSDGVPRFHIDSHPFELKITEAQTKSIIKVFKAIYKSLDISDLLTLQSFLENFSKYITNTDLKNKFKNISPLNNIDPDIIKDLINYGKDNTEIIMYYNSAGSGKKNINIIVDKMNVANGKLYVYGVNSEYNNYSSFLVSRIIKIIGVNMQKSELNMPEMTIGYEFNINGNETFIPLKNEKIISKTPTSYVVEMTSKNKFDLIQRVMSHANSCKVLYPENFKQDVIDCLKRMKEGYFEKK